MARTSPALLALAAFAAPVALAQQPAPAAPAAAAPTATFAGEATPVPELTGLDKAPDSLSLRLAIVAARERIPHIADPAERTLTAATLDAIEARPADAAQLLAGHTARLTEIRDKVPETIFLTGLVRCKTPEETVSFARETRPYADKLGDAALRDIVRDSLARLEAKPGDAADILKAHMRRVGERFYAAAKACFDANDARGSLSSVQIAVRCDPANVKARFLFAHLLNSAMNDTDSAIQTMRVGLTHLDAGAPETAGYLDRYFQLLESRELDNEVVTAAGTLLAKGGFDARTKEMLAMHLATCLHYLDRNADALRVIELHALTKRAQGTLLQARCHFENRNTEAAARSLDEAASRFSGAERDALLSQLQRFRTDLGNDALALEVADRRIREFPDRSSPRVHRLWLFERQGERSRFGAETRAMLERFGEDQAAVLGIANLGADRGLPGLANDCFRLAQKNNFNRPLFALLVIEAHVNAREFREAVAAHRRFIALDKRLFKETEHTVHALLAAAKTGLGDAVSKNEAERHVKGFLESKKPLAPQSYSSCAALLRRAGDTASAMKMLEAGHRAAPWNNQVRADLAALRLATGEAEAYGTRPAIEDELLAIAQGRRVHHRLWEAVGIWLQSAPKLPADKLAALRALASARSRPDLVSDSLRD